MNRIRAFVGIPLPGELAAGYEALQRTLGGLRGVKWVELANLHLTLQFLGSIESTAVSSVAGALSRAAAGGRRALLTPERVTAFPRPKAARVLVVELADPGGAVGRLREAVVREMAGLGFDPGEQEFRTHVTLGRVREGRLDASAMLATAPVPAGSWSVESFELIESRLGSRGPTYRSIGSFRLGEAESLT